jgi:hypothetical protein
LIVAEVIFQEVNYTLTDVLGNTYTGTSEKVAGGTLTLPGVAGCTFTNENMDGNNYTATINFPFPVSKEGRVINSTGVVYNGCVLIRQHEKVGNRDYYQMYSWDVPHKCYTYISFDKEKPMIACFNKLKSTQVNLHNEDISSKFAELDISFDDIAQVKLHQNMNSFSLDDMFRDRVVNQENEASLKR